MEERRQGVKRQHAVVANTIAVVVDHVTDSEDDNEACKEDDRNYTHYPNGNGAAFEQEQPGTIAVRVHPKFRVESVDDPTPSNRRSATIDSADEDDNVTGKNYTWRNGRNSATPPRNHSLIRPSLSVETAFSAGANLHRRGSAATTTCAGGPCASGSKMPAFGGGLRVSVSACHLPSLHNCSNGNCEQRFCKNSHGLRFPNHGLSEPGSIGGSYESLSDASPVEPATRGHSNSGQNISSNQLTSVPSYFLLARQKSGPVGWNGGYANFHKSATYGASSSSTAVTPPNAVNSALGRRCAGRSSWAGGDDHYSLNNASSIDLLYPPRTATGSLDYHHATKHVYTEQLLLSKHALKVQQTKMQTLLDKAFALIAVDSEITIGEGVAVVVKVMTNAWAETKIGLDLACGLCDYLRESGYFAVLINLFINERSGDAVLNRAIRLETCKALEKCLNASNRDYVLNGNLLEVLIPIAKTFTETEEVRVVVHLLETLFKHNARVNARLIDLSALEYILNACKSTTDTETFRYASVALANLTMYSDNDCQQKMISKNVPDWLFLLASNQDQVTRYYACLAICALVSNKEVEAAVIKSGTLSLVEPFLLAQRPADFVTADNYKHHGRPKEFLQKLVTMLKGKRREPRSMAAFHFAMDASIKEKQDRLDVLREIGAVEALKLVAALPEEAAPKFAIDALEIIGEELPHKLSRQVPLWTVDDVQYWINKIGFEQYASTFSEQKVDGDLLLLLTEDELERDVGITSGLMRKRFMRELDSLKIAADYSCLDGTHLDSFLISIDPRFSIYTYRLLEIGVDRSTLQSLNDDMLREDCHIDNAVHRMKLLQCMEECKATDDMDVVLLSKQIDIFISYRRSTGNQLASLLKVLLQLRGYKVFIDVDRLYAGKFDSSLLKNIQAAKHFVLVLTPYALDRCIDDEDCNDWVHKEITCAMGHDKNVIPVFDPHFEWPDGSALPADMRALARFNGVHWVHEYQEACVDKLEKFIKGELNRDAYPTSQRPSNKQAAILNFRNASKSGSNGYINYQAEHTELVLEALTNRRSARGSSQDHLPCSVCMDHNGNC